MLTEPLAPQTEEITYHSMDLKSPRSEDENSDSSTVNLGQITQNSQSTQQTSTQEKVKGASNSDSSTSSSPKKSTLPSKSITTKKMG